MKPFKKIWIKKKENTYICYACRYPYTEKDIIEEGVLYEVWITLETV